MKNKKIFEQWIYSNYKNPHELSQTLNITEDELLLEFYSNLKIKVKKKFQESKLKIN